ncbi:MAG TPA: hypothetical protein VIF09_26760 [Polyangiaceae bacterium]|jgi:hypothetical protein
MRLRFTVGGLALLASVMWGGKAGATGLCDPGGHFCLHLDAASARVCTPLALETLDVGGCDPGDGAVRDAARRMAVTTKGALRAVALAIVHADETTSVVMVMRRPAEPEVTGDGGAQEAVARYRSAFASAAHAGWLVEDVAPPRLDRIRGVQVARIESRMSTAGIGGAVVARSVIYEVRARDAAYLVAFDGDERDAAHLVAMADATMASLDAVPAHTTSGGPGDALVWLLRALVTAVVLAAGFVLWGRRKGGRRPIEPRDLWPG